MPGIDVERELLSVADFLSILTTSPLMGLKAQNPLFELCYIKNGIRVTICKLLVEQALHCRQIVLL